MSTANNICFCGEMKIQMYQHPFFVLKKKLTYLKLWPASVAQLDVHPTGEQEVGVRPLPGRQQLSWRFDHEIFLQPFSAFG